VSIPARPADPTADVAVPLYRRLSAAIRDDILARDLRPGDALEPERVLVNDFRVSRVTLRKAIDELVNEGLVVRKQGLGTFVAAPKVRHPHVGLHSTREVAGFYGLAVKADVVRFGFARANRRESNLLDIPEGARVLRFTRRDLAAGETLCVVDCTLPADYARSLTPELLVDHSTYELIEAEGATRLVAARQTLRATGANRRLSQLLDVKPGTPLLVLERVAYDQEGASVELATVCYPYDRAECVVELRRQPNTRDEAATGVAVTHTSLLEGSESLA
jgi:GntR family transcriptional regulator